MKKFFINFTIFITILIIVNYFLFRIVYNNYFIDYEKVNLNYTTYLLADSHGPPVDKVNEKYRFYNFSIGSDSYVDMKRKVEYLIENSNVERIILTADEHILSRYRDKSNNLDRSLFFANYLDFENLHDFISSKYIKRYIPLVNSKSRDIVKIYFNFKKSYAEKKSNRKDWNSLNTEEKLIKSKNRILYQFATTYKSEIQLKALCGIISICKINNIEIIGLKYPLSKPYIEALSNNTYNIDSIFIANNLKLYDFSKLYINKDSYFYNEDHLNKIGGEFFSQEIYKILENKK